MSVTKLKNLTIIKKAIFFHSTVNYFLAFVAYKYIFPPSLLFPFCHFRLITLLWFATIQKGVDLSLAWLLRLAFLLGNNSYLISIRIVKTGRVSPVAFYFMFLLFRMFIRWWFQDFMIIGLLCQIPSP